MLEEDIILAVGDLVNFKPDAIVFIGFSAGIEQFVRAAAARTELANSIVFATDGAKDSDLIESLSSPAQQAILKNFVGSSRAFRGSLSGILSKLFRPVPESDSAGVLCSSL